jgi:thiol-disulfide isomerase/thioredoxin
MAAGDDELPPELKRARQIMELRTSADSLMRIGPAAKAAAERELAGFAKLLAEARDPKAAEVAEILLTEAGLRMEVLEDFERAKAIAVRIEAEFAGMSAAQAAAQLRGDIERRIAFRRTQQAIVGRPAPDMTFAWSSKKGPSSLAELRGKVVVLFFWTTWHERSVSGLDSIQDLVGRYAETDVAFVAVTSVQGVHVAPKGQSNEFRGNPKGEMRAMGGYVKSKRLAWTVAFSEQAVFNPDYGIYRLPVMVVIGADGTVRYFGQADATAKLTKIDLIDAALAQAGRKPAAP